MTAARRLALGSAVAALCAAAALPGCSGPGVDPQYAIASGLVSEAGTDAPLKGAFVVLGGEEATTGEDGTFLIERIVIPEDKQSTLTVSCDKYRTYDEVFRFDAPGDLKVSLEPVADPEATGTVDGVVRDDATELGLGEAEITVRLLIGGDVIDTQKAHSSNAGNWQVSGIPIGTANVQGIAPGYLPAEADVEVEPGRASNPIVYLDLVEGTRRVTVTGQVFDVETREPVAGVAVSQDEGDASGVTDETGAFALENVLVGQRTFRANAEGYDPAFVTVLILADPPPLSIGIAKASGEPPSPPGTIAGKVTVQGAETNAGVSLVLRDRFDAIVARATTGETGGFGFLVLPGTYTLTAALTGYAQAQVEVTYAFGDPVTDLELVLVPTG